MTTEEYEEQQKYILEKIREYFLKASDQQQIALAHDIRDYCDEHGSWNGDFENQILDWGNEWLLKNPKLIPKKS